jgi:hypothetical protein
MKYIECNNITLDDRVKYLENRIIPLEGDKNGSIY